MLKAYCVISDYGVEAQNMLRDTGVILEISHTDKRPDESELIDLVQKYDILIIGAKEKMTQAVYNAASKLKILGTLSIGMDHIDPIFLRNNRIKVINCPNSNVISVAEHTFGLMLALQKKIIEGNESVLNGTGRKGLNGLSHDLCNKNLGVIGAGKIATEVIRIAQAFNMNICCFTFNPQHHVKLKCQGIKFVSLDDLLVGSDIISIHLPLTELTEGLISREKIELLKENAIFINTSREQIVDTEYLLKYADNHSNFQVGLDIETDEVQDSISTRRKNVLITPHIGGVSLEAMTRMDGDLAKDIVSYINKNGVGQ